MNVGVIDGATVEGENVGSIEGANVGLDGALEGSTVGVSDG